MTKVTSLYSGESYGSNRVYRFRANGFANGEQFIAARASTLRLRCEYRSRTASGRQRATPAANPAQAAKGAEFIITMLPNGDLVRHVLFGENGVCESLSSDALVIDMSTIHPLQTDKLIADMQARGFSMMDVPVGRTSANAITGTLLLLAGGTAEQVERATPILMAMGSELINAGGPGMGIRVKLINNYMSIALNALSAEAAVLCEALNLPSMLPSR